MLLKELEILDEDEGELSGDLEGGIRTATADRPTAASPPDRPAFKTKKVTNWMSDDETEAAAIGGGLPVPNADRGRQVHEKQVRHAEGGESQSGDMDSLLDNINEPAFNSTKTPKTRNASGRLNKADP